MITMKLLKNVQVFIFSFCFITCSIVTEKVFAVKNGCTQTSKSSVFRKDKNEKWLKFRVASYNIRYAAANDEKIENGWDIRKKPLSELIKSHDFDIVGTQEGNASQLSDLDTLLSTYSYVAHPYGGRDGNLHNCATFYKFSMFDVLDSGTFWYSETPDVPSIGWDATDQRICNWIKFREKTTGKEFYFFNSHFYWRYVTAKANSGTVLVNKIREIAGDSPVICTGDYNSTDSTTQIQKILTLLKDAYRVTKTAPVGPVETGFPGGVFEGKAVSRIDYIFISSHFRVLDYKALDDSYNQGRYPSDHFPVTSRVAIKIAE